MAEEKNLKQAKVVYNTLCELLKAEDWHYVANEEKLTVECGAKGDDLPIPIKFEIDPERMLIILMSEMPFNIAEENRGKVVVAVSCANNGLVDGSFDFDILSGNLLFRMTTSYMDCLIGKELLEYMLMCACATVDHYNDKFLLVASKDMTFDQVVEFID